MAMPVDTIMECIHGRRSVRRFRPEPPEREKLETLLEAARWAPSNHNRQAWKFLVVEDRRTIDSMAAAVEGRLDSMLAASSTPSRYADELRENSTLFKRAPAVIVALHREPTAFSLAFMAEIERGRLISGELVSSAMAVQNMLLAAHAAGLGACVLTGPLVAEDEIRRLLDIPGAYNLTCLVAVGYPSENPAAPRRKSIGQIAEFPGGIR